MRRRFALVYNERAGGIRPLLLDRVLVQLRSKGAEVAPVRATSAAEATARVGEIARTGAADAVIAAGGDGTIRGVAAGVAETSVPVGVIPLGTGNVMKYEIGLPKHAEGIADVLLDGPEIRARGGLVNGAPFFLMVGAGFDGAIVSQLRHGTKRVFGRAAYAAPVVKTLAQRPQLFDVEVDGGLYQASWLIVTNAAHYGGSFTLTRDTSIGADKLIAVLVTRPTRRALVAAGVALAAGRLGDPARAPKGVVVLPAQHVRAGTVTSVAVEVDGDEAGMTPIDVRAGGPQFKLIVPPAYVAHLTNRHTNRLASGL